MAKEKKKVSTYQQRMKKLSAADRKKRLEYQRQLMAKKRELARAEKAAELAAMVPVEKPGSDLEEELVGVREQVIAASRALKEEMPQIKLGVDGRFLVNKHNMRLLYKRTWDSLEDVGDEDDWDDKAEEDGWQPHPLIQKVIRAHFKRRPFDKIRMGLLRIVTKGGNLVWFDVWDEQMVLLRDLEEAWYNGEYYAQITLKSRQIGSTTFWTAVHYCYQSTLSHKTSHVVMHIMETAEGVLDMFRMFYESEPYWMRPRVRKKSDPLILHGNGVKRAKIKIESAERRDRVSRSITVQFRHLSEIPYWVEPTPTYNALLASTEWAWPLIHIEESTGKNINDVFYERFHDAMAGKVDGFKAYFFPWFEHKAYRKDIPRDKFATEADFRMSLSEDDIAMWDKYKLDKEQVYWYITRRSREVSSGKLTVDMFKREYPCSVEEAFIGASSNFFEPERSKMDIYRLRQENRVKTDYQDLKRSVSGFGKQTNWLKPVPYARCSLVTDLINAFENPKFVDDDNGMWTVWEKPRAIHKYVVSVDICRGKLTQKSVQKSSDNDSMSVWRYTYEKGEPKAFVQVAHYHGRCEGGPIDLAELAVAVSALYCDQSSGGDRALIVPENNSHGLAFVEETKRLGGNQYQRVEYGKTGEVVSRTLGFMTTAGGENAQGSKNHLLMRFRKEWNNDRVIVMSPQTAMEMSVFVNNDGKLEAMLPYHDDTVMEAALAIEGVKYELGEIEPVLVSVGGSGFMDMLTEESMGLEQGEKIDVFEFRQRLLEGMGVRLERQVEHDRKKWL